MHQLCQKQELIAPQALNDTIRSNRSTLIYLQCQWKCTTKTTQRNQYPVIFSRNFKLALTISAFTKSSIPLLNFSQITKLSWAVHMYKICVQRTNTRKQIFRSVYQFSWTEVPHTHFSLTEKTAISSGLSDKLQRDFKMMSQNTRNVWIYRSILDPAHVTVTCTEPPTQHRTAFFNPLSIQAFAIEHHC